MIKMLGLLTRKPHLTHEQFVDHWLNIHGPLALAVPGIRRYVQSHIVGTRTRPDIPETEQLMEAGFSPFRSLATMHFWMLKHESKGKR